MARLIVFDLDGTLVDSRRDLAEAANQMLCEYGCTPLAEAEIGRMVGDGAATLVARALEAAGSPRPKGDRVALDRFLTIYNARLLTCTRPYPGIPDVLGTLQSRATLAVLTNKPLGPAREILEGLDLARYFAAELVVGGDGPYARKPDPSGLLALARRASSRPAATTLVGDSVVDWRTARAAGTGVCLARYGFGFEGFPLVELGPGELVVDRTQELATVL